MRGPDGKPIEKALVIAIAGVSWGASGMTPVAARTAGGLVPRPLTNVAPGTPLSIDLVRGGTIEGVVRDGDTGQPLGRVRVEARAANTNMFVPAGDVLIQLRRAGAVGKAAVRGGEGEYVSVQMTLTAGSKPDR